MSAVEQSGRVEDAGNGWWMQGRECSKAIRTKVDGKQKQYGRGMRDSGREQR